MIFHKAMVVKHLDTVKKVFIKQKYHLTCYLNGTRLMTDTEMCSFTATSS